MNNDPNLYIKGLENISRHLCTSSPDAQLGTTRNVIFQKDKVQVFCYRRANLQAPEVAVLIVYALVNRPYVLDIKPDRSFIKSLIDLGLTVYLIDWGYPDDAERNHDLHSYISGYMDSCVDAVRIDSDSDKLNLLGVCQGGTLSLCYTALYQHKVNSLTLMVTPVDFQAGNNLLARWVKYVDIDELVDVLGNIPGSYLDAMLQSLKPLSNTLHKYLKFIHSMSDDALAAERLESFGLMQRWLHDRPDQPAEFTRQFVKNLYQSNQLVKGVLLIGGEPVDLKAINIPIHNIYASVDHIVPRESSQALESLLRPGIYTESAVDAGHIGIFISTSALNKVPKLVADWIKKHA